MPENLKTDLMEELGEKIVVREGEETRRVSKQRAVVKTLVAKTQKGDGHSGRLLTGLMMRLLDTGEDVPGEIEPLHDDELEILAAFEARRVGRDHASARRAPSEVEGGPEGPEGRSAPFLQPGGRNRTPTARHGAPRAAPGGPQTSPTAEPKLTSRSWPSR